ncbi:uncharacterized protein KY384_008032 [Bacidia gigantensis]|uniref:uncharacterized protein n=1 Tax=Bacidia gigantensis TaxID=2732470 RepID=UPI001D05B7BA|nr:uncharacterized protein KY384_008032 [Bacidia gigantensis]KAG8527288.1 hypothetical protein KY384_008032 [Bacidia gigantensis]
MLLSVLSSLCSSLSSLTSLGHTVHHHSIFNGPHRDIPSSKSLNPFCPAQNGIIPPFGQCLVPKKRAHDSGYSAGALADLLIANLPVHVPNSEDYNLTVAQQDGLDKWHTCIFPPYDTLLDASKHRSVLTCAFEAFDHLFFGSSLGSKVDLGWEAYSNEHLGRTLSPYLTRKDVPEDLDRQLNPNRFDTIGISLPKSQESDGRIIWSKARFTKTLGTVLHEMVHAYFNVYGCSTCAIVGLRETPKIFAFRQRSELGYGHGTSWVRALEAITKVARKVLDTESLGTTSLQTGILEGKCSEVQTLVLADILNFHARNESEAQIVSAVAFGLLSNGSLINGSISDCDRAAAWAVVREKAATQVEHFRAKDDHVSELTMIRILELSEILLPHYRLACYITRAFKWIGLLVIVYCLHRLERRLLRINWPFIDRPWASERAAVPDSTKIPTHAEVRTATRAKNIRAQMDASVEPIAEYTRVIEPEQAKIIATEGLTESKPKRRGRPRRDETPANAAPTKGYNLRSRC